MVTVELPLLAALVSSSILCIVWFSVLLIAECYTPECVEGMCTAPDVCTCDSGWTGSGCTNGNAQINAEMPSQNPPQISNL